MMVIDTLAKNFLGDENTAKDMSRFVNNCIALRRDIGGSVVIVHHSGKDTSKGARGSISLLQGVETQIEAEGAVSRGTTLYCEKQKDAAPFNPIPLQKRWMPIPDDPEGSLVMVREKVSLKLTDERREILSALKNAFGDRIWCFTDGYKVLPRMAKTTYSDKLKHLGVRRVDRMVGRRLLSQVRSTGAIAGFSVGRSWSDGWSAISVSWSELVGGLVGRIPHKLRRKRLVGSWSDLVGIKLSIWSEFSSSL